MGSEKGQTECAAALSGGRCYRRNGRFCSCSGSSFATVFQGRIKNLQKW